MKTAELFDLEKTIASKLLLKYEYPYESVREIGNFVINLGRSLDYKRFTEVSENVWVANTAEVSPSANISPPCIIDEGAQIRHCAFIRGNVIVGKKCVVGNSTEVKNSIIFDSAQIPHFNYVGDSILGYASHLGAGAVTSNVKSDKSNVSVVQDGVKYETKLKKLGAMVGDNTEIGCGCVLCPGAVIGKNCTVYPQSVVRGTVRHNTIFKSPGNIVAKN